MKNYFLSHMSYEKPFLSKVVSYEKLIFSNIIYVYY